MKHVSSDELPDIIRAELRAAANGITPVLNIGITGTREAPHIPQKTKLAVILYRMITRYPGTARVHHGCCKGIDEQAHSTTRQIAGTEIYGYPGEDSKGRSPQRMETTEGFTVLYPPARYAERNQMIVNACTVLIACPLHPEEHPRSLRSGTWQTIRYARRSRKPVIYILPNGELFL